MLCSAVYRQSYAGEFGGFDIDIGADEGILDNWDEEPGGNQEAAVPEQSVNESNGMEAGGENSESSAGVPDNAALEGSGGELDKENQGSGTGAAEKENQGSSSSTSNKENDASVSIKEPPKSSDSVSNKKNQGNSASASNKKNQENSVSVPNKESWENSSMPAVSENKNAGEVKLPESATPKVESTVEKEKAVSEIKNTEIPKEEKNNGQKKITSLGMVFTAVGMAKTSPELKFYNSNDLNEKIDTNTTKNNNKNVYFEHKSKIPINEYPSIQIIRTAEEQDITILSLRLNGEEVFWHQEGDTLILDQPAAEKKNIVELIAAIDGSWIVRMPVWEF